LATSGWLETAPGRPCYCKWSLSESEWRQITDKLTADNNDRIYYRAVTCTVPTGSGIPCVLRQLFYRGPVEYPNPSASHVRWSTRPADGLFGDVEPPFAVVNQWGTAPFPSSYVTDESVGPLPFDLPPPPQPVPKPRVPPVPPIAPVIGTEG
jgi:hypothetical protein